MDRPWRAYGWRPEIICSIVDIDLHLRADELAVLDNPFWESLSTVHARFGTGGPVAKRFDADVSVFGGIADTTPAAWEALAELLGPGQTVLLARAGEIDPPAGWERVGGSPGHQMVLAELTSPPPVTDRIVQLTADHVPQMIGLVELAQPGPFRPRTIELGGFHGVFDGDQLVAMAGERLQTPGFAELSGVSTHPDARGRGLAAALSHRVATAILERGQRPVLHVRVGNDGAQRIYERLGFVVRTQVMFTAVRSPRT